MSDRRLRARSRWRLWQAWCGSRTGAGPRRCRCGCRLGRSGCTRWRRSPTRRRDLNASFKEWSASVCGMSPCSLRSRGRLRCNAFWVKGSASEADKGTPAVGGLFDLVSHASLYGPASLTSAWEELTDSVDWRVSIRSEYARLDRPCRRAHDSDRRPVRVHGPNRNPPGTEDRRDGHGVGGVERERDGEFPRYGEAFRGPDGSESATRRDSGKRSAHRTHSERDPAGCCCSVRPCADEGIRPGRKTGAAEQRPGHERHEKPVRAELDGPGVSRRENLRHLCQSRAKGIDLV